jgi:hypothetical protein
MKCDNCEQSLPEVWYRLCITTRATKFYLRICGHCWVTSFMSLDATKRLGKLAHDTANAQGRTEVADARSGRSQSGLRRRTPDSSPTKDVANPDLTGERPNGSNRST